MATTRLLRSHRLLGRVLPPTTVSSSVAKVKCISKSQLKGERMVSADDDGDNKRKKPTVAVKASTVELESWTSSETQVGRRIDLASLLTALSRVFFGNQRPVKNRKTWIFEAQSFIERVVINCRFFTMFAVAGSLFGTVLCFVEGCVLILESYFHYFHSLSRSLDQVHTINLLIEAIDMFLIGIALFVFGVGLYVMFVGSKNENENGSWLPESSLFGLFNLKSLPTWVEMGSVSKAKSRIGHAVTMILQVGLLEKFKNVPLLTSLDLACFAGAVLISSSCIYLLSRLSSDGIIRQT
ncbi:hypothetical protein K2173_007500 [Erythroxylum novogranatense]|uniref:Uncharacterized protein n=1 Tax=Erythroxylum novogranatense TaxID=1862640 RepID=A0AAV8T6D4_9ROSI|nr:hypothetical protein K2173_007500 [Erythroxylum novogranatense]